MVVLRGSSARIALLLVISPYAKRNSVDHTPTTQVSITCLMDEQAVVLAP
jgi:hypothetical protein